VAVTWFSGDGAGGDPVSEEEVAGSEIDVGSDIALARRGVHDAVDRPVVGDAVDLAVVWLEGWSAPRAATLLYQLLFGSRSPGTTRARHAVEAPGPRCSKSN
jgi:hypothetical protein